MYEPHQSAEIENEACTKKKKKSKNTFQIQNMQMCWFLLNSGVCITLVDTVSESFSVPLVYRLQNTLSSGIFHFKKAHSQLHMNTLRFSAFGDTVLCFPNCRSLNVSEIT